MAFSKVEAIAKVDRDFITSRPAIDRSELDPVILLKSMGDLVGGLNRTGRARMMESIADYLEGHTILTNENLAVLGSVLRRMGAAENKDH